MDAILHLSENAPWQQLGQEWFGAAVEPPLELRFLLRSNTLSFSARRAAPAHIHPEAREGRFQEHLWKYDTAECFIATAEADRYIELNLSPNGAWWSAAFTAPRIVNPAMPARPQGVIATGHADEHGWECELQLPLDYLRHMGIIPGGNTRFRLAAAAILNSPEQLFLTTASTTTGRPDFHHPWDWAFARLAPGA